MYLGVCSGEGERNEYDVFGDGWGGYGGGVGEGVWGGWGGWGEVREGMGKIWWGGDYCVCVLYLEFCGGGREGGRERDFVGIWDGGK